jgi:PAS domain S-box-containing protein
MLQPIVSKTVKIYADRKCNIVRCSKNVKQLFGMHTRDLIGENVSILCTEPHRSMHAQYVERFNQTGQARVLGFARNLLAQHRSGREFPVSLQVTPYQKGFKVRVSLIPATPFSSFSLQGKLLSLFFCCYCSPGPRAARIVPLEGAEAMLTVSDGGRVLAASDQCRALFGLTEAELQEQVPHFDGLFRGVVPSTMPHATRFVAELLCKDGAKIKVRSCGVASGKCVFT